MTRSAVASPSLATLRSLVPSLAPNAYKGQAGKVGVIGGGLFGDLECQFARQIIKLLDLCQRWQLVQ